MDASAIPSAETVAEARQQAHRLGWVHDKIGRDLCPDCRTFKSKNKETRS